jgi:peptidoglycan/LPS O-acetylase OafA/YrhL
MATTAISAAPVAAAPTVISSAPGAAVPGSSRRVDWLDGVRAAAAMFVVLHHMWLAVWPQFPRNVGPWWVGWMLYGHLAVAVFIVVSGFSLALAPMRRGGNLSGGTKRFLSRRAWRIVPPYWAALIISTIITALILQPNVGSGAAAKGFVVHGLLLQDVVGSFAPNGAFWSIAVEWQIYFLFPLILLLGRKTSIGRAVLFTVALVIVAQAVAGIGSPLNKIHHVSPQFLALFALGVLAVSLVHGDRAGKLRRPLTAAGLVAIGSFVVLAVTEGSVWVVGHYFWIDMLFGVGVACLMAAMFGGGLPRVRGVFASRVAVTLGLFSYSIYLLHGPLVGLVCQEVLYPMHLSPLATFATLLAIGIPFILLVCYAFHLVFEAPFLRARDKSAFRAMPIVGRLLPKTADARLYAPASATPEAVAVAPEAS